jgi:DeoR/GlpR family transcriptional regulator of sugar metabolism
MIMQETAHLYGISEQTLYRALAQRARPKALRRSDRGTPRVVPQQKTEYYCELIAAIKDRGLSKSAEKRSFFRTGY